MSAATQAAAPANLAGGVDLIFKGRAAVQVCYLDDVGTNAADLIPTQRCSGYIKEVVHVHVRVHVQPRPDRHRHPRARPRHGRDGRWRLAGTGGQKLAVKLAVDGGRTFGRSATGGGGSGSRT